MRVSFLVSWTMMAVGCVSAQAVAAALSSVRVNGWFPCAFTVPQFDSDAPRLPFECAKVELPLCYDGICKGNTTIDVFVKRLVRKKPHGSKRAVLLVPGGPGASSVSIEQRMTALSDKLNGSADVYTFDHRGSGRSAFLDCQAARGLDDDRWQASDMTDKQLRHCIEDLAFQYPDQAAAFSAASVAMDIREITSILLADHVVFLFSFSYGTYVAQQVVKLQVPQITGYIFDSVDLESSSADATIQTDQSHWNEVIVSPTKRLLQHCYDDASCPLKFKARDRVVEELLALYEGLDRNAASNACARFLHALRPTQRPSKTLRDLISDAVASVNERMDVIRTLARLQRCSSEDLSALRAVYDEDDESRIKRSRVNVRDVDRFESTNMLLHYTIVSSERWNRPSVSKTELQAMYTSGPFSVEIDEYRTRYCLFIGATNDPACSDVSTDDTEASRAATFAHTSPKLVSQTLRDGASALILTGGLDFATPSEFAELLFEELLGGSGRMLVTFDYGTHCGGEAAEEGDTMSCYWDIVSQYIKADGDVHTVDTSCMEKLPGLVFPKV